MEGMDFQELIDEFPVTVRWEASNLCPCTGADGMADQSCVICLGKGRWFSPLSKPFEVGLISQSARNRAAMANTMGPGATGSSVLIVPCSAVCYAGMNSGDRIYDQRVLDAHQVLMVPNTRAALPAGFTKLRAWVKSSDGLSLVEVAPPVPNDKRRITVAVATSFTFDAPRAYEAVKEFGSIRSFGTGLPKRWTLNLLDLSVR
jgi:hypothetical protein